MHLIEGNIPKSSSNISLPGLKIRNKSVSNKSALNIFNTIDKVYNPYITRTKFHYKKPSMPPMLLRQNLGESGMPEYHLELPRYPTAQRSVSNSMVQFSSHRAKLCNLYNDIKSIDLQDLGPKRKYVKIWRI